MVGEDAAGEVEEWLGGGEGLEGVVVGGEGEEGLTEQMPQSNPVIS